MFALLTSCNRHDLLRRTVVSLLHKQQQSISIFINEDSDESLPTDVQRHIAGTFCSGGIGQHAAIEQRLDGLTDKYYLHCEDDWLFDNSYDWITESIKIMEADPTIIKVLCRNGSPHPCVHDRIIENENVNVLLNIQDLPISAMLKQHLLSKPITKSNGVKFGYLHPWENDGILWHGFSWNPGVTRLDLLKQFIPFGKREQDVAEAIHAAGYKIAELSIPIYTHIGDGRSTPR